MSTFKFKQLDNGNVEVTQEWFDGQSMVSSTATYCAVGSYVHRINPNGTTSQVCEQLLPTWPTLMVGSSLVDAIRRTVS